VNKGGGVQVQKEKAFSHPIEEGSGSEKKLATQLRKKKKQRAKRGGFLENKGGGWESEVYYKADGKKAPPERKKF